MSEIIEHSGIIENINGRTIRVQIIQESACSGCHAKGACSAADMQDKYIDVEADQSDYKVGDTVTVYGKSSMGLFAVLLAFVVPFLLVLLTLFILKNQVNNESISAVISLLVLVAYYIILSFFNKKLKSKLKFLIRRY